MDSHVWRVIYQAIREVNRAVPRMGRRSTYSDVLIVGMYMWAVGHDRPLCWACDRGNYGSCFRPRRLPSVSQFSRRVRSDRCERILQGVYEQLAGYPAWRGVGFIDARPLVVGACSKDGDARAGRVYGGFARGYRLHAFVAENGQIPAWSVTSLNVSGPPIAERLVHQVQPKGLVLGDGDYDSRSLYDAVAQYGGQLVTPLPKNPGRGHHRQSVSRLAMIGAGRGLRRYVYRDRIAVERTFSQQSSFGGGLAPLPSWVRTLPRVRRWVGAKLIIYHARLSLRRAVS